MAMLLKVYVTDTMLPSITIHNFINVALFLIELLIYLEDVVEFVKKIPSIQNVLAYLTLQSAAWQKHCKFLCKLFSYSCSICHAVVFQSADVWLWQCGGVAKLG